MIRAVLFDFGRVISASKPASLFDGYEKELGLIPGTINTIMFESPLWQQALLGRLGMSEYWQAIGPQLNLSSRAAIQRFQTRYFEDEQINTVVLDIIKQLISSFKLAIVSNHPPGLCHWLAAWNIEHLFDVVICSGDEGVAKPDAAIFQLALERLSITAEEALFVDDTLEHVHAARELGMHGHHFLSAEKLILDMKKMGITCCHHPLSR